MTSVETGGLKTSIKCDLAWQGLKRLRRLTSIETGGLKTSIKCDLAWQGLRLQQAIDKRRNRRAQDIKHDLAWQGLKWPRRLTSEETGGLKTSIKRDLLSSSPSQLLINNRYHDSQ